MKIMSGPSWSIKLRLEPTHRQKQADALHRRSRSAFAMNYWTFTSTSCKLDVQIFEPIIQHFFERSEEEKIVAFQLHCTFFRIPSKALKKNIFYGFFMFP